MHDVFISYAHEDRALARKLADALLAARGWSVWWDTSLRTGEQFPRRIQEAVAASRCVVVLWSRHSVESNWVVAEASEGWERRVLAPVMLDDSQPPMPFRQTQSHVLSQWHGEAGRATLLALIEDIQRIHAHGGVVDAAELAERERRRRTYQRRKLLRRSGVAAAVVLLAIGGVLLWHHYETTRVLTAQAEELARAADGARNEALALTPEQATRFWWVHLYEDSARLERLELSVLLGIEAMRRRPSERAERALRDSLAQLPWSDQHVEIEDDDLPFALDFNGAGRLVAAGGGVGGAFVWDLDRNAIAVRVPHGGTGGKGRWEDKRGKFVGGRGSRQIIDFNPRRDVIATAGPDSTARVWDARDGRELLRLTHAETATAVAFDAAGEQLATSDESGAVCVWTAGSGEKRHCVAQGSPVYWIGFSPSGALLASVGLDGGIDIWDAASGERRHHFQHDTAAKAVRFDPREKLLASFGSETDTRLWSLDSGAELWRVQAPSSTDAGVAFATPGDTLIVAGADGALSWWDLKARALRFSIPTGATFLIGMVVSPERRYLVTIDDNREARAWDAESGRLLKRVPYADLQALAISPDGEFFATAGQDGATGSYVLAVKRIRPEDAVATACAQLSRNLTRSEWYQYLGDEPYRPTCTNIDVRSAR